MPAERMASDDLKKDGYLNVDVAARNIVYHPHLNVILIFTKCGDVKVLDVNSGVILQSCHLSGESFASLLLLNVQ